jgi:hypothetical protein
LLGHRDAEPAVAREGLVEIGGEAACLFALLRGLVALQPVVVVEARAELRDRLADALLLGGQREVQAGAIQLCSAMPPSTTIEAPVT